MILKLHSGTFASALDDISKKYSKPWPTPKFFT